VGSKSFSSRRDALALAENFQSIFTDNAEAVHVAPSSFTDLQELGERSTVDDIVFTEADVDSEPEQYRKKENDSERHARYRRELFESAEQLTVDAEQSMGLLSTAQGMTRWHQAWNAVTSIQLQHLVKGNAPKVVTWSDRGTGGTRNSARPCVPDFLAEVWLAARRSLSLTQFTLWKQLVVEEKGERLEEFAKQHREVYEQIAKLVGSEFERSLIFPTRSYFQEPYAVGVARRSARLRHQAHGKRNPPRVRHRKAA
jgi:hypothetical protein